MAKQVVVVGAGQGGLSAAIHARLRGFDVLVLEQRERAGGKAARIDVQGYRLDPGPSIVILTRLYEAVFRAAGRRMEDYLRFRRLDPFSRVCFEGRDPIDLPADTEACLALLRKEAPEDAVAFDELLRALDKVSPLIDRSIFDHPYTKPWQLADPNLVRTALHFDVRATYKELVDRRLRSPLLRAFFYGFPSYGGQTYDSKAPGALMIPYLMVREGVWWPEGGIAAIPEAFERLATELGVEFRYGAKVTGLDVDSGRVRAVLCGSERIETDQVILNMDRNTAQSWMGNPETREPSLSYFTVHWGIRRSLGGLSHHVLTIPQDFEIGFEELYRRSAFPSRPIVYLNATHLEDPSTAPAGCSNLFAVITVPATGPDWTQERELVARVRSEIARFGFDFSDDEIEFERVQSPPLFETRDGSYRGSLYGLHERHRLWGLFPPTNADDRVRGLFYCGGAVQPGAGLPMVTLSGRFAAEMLR